MACFHVVILGIVIMFLYILQALFLLTIGNSKGLDILVPGGKTFLMFDYMPFSCLNKSHFIVGILLLGIYTI